MNGATFSELKLFVLRDLLVPLPPLPLQQAFAKRIEAIEKQKQLISSEIKDLETLLASRMQYWFDQN
jgi:type I restriction enzyme S subunit